MRIAVEARYLLTEEKTGVENYTYSLLSALAQSQGEHELHLYLHRRPRAAEDEMLRPFRSSPRVHFHAVPPLRLWLKLWMPLAARLQGAQVGLFPGSILPLYLLFPAVMVVYDLAWAHYPQHYPQREIRIFRDIYPRCLAKAKMVFAISEFTKQDIQRVYGTPAEKIRVVPCAVDPTFSPLASAAEEAGEKWGLEPGFLLAVGTSHPRKDIATLLRGYALARHRLPLPALALIGPGEAASGPLAALAEELGISERVRWLGYVPHRHLPLLYRAAGVFVMPSLYEGFGLPALEAMACGTPVICSNAGALPEVAGDAAILVEPGRPEAFAEALVSVLSGQALSQQLRERGLKRAAEFSWENSAKLALTYLREACGG